MQHTEVLADVYGTGFYQIFITFCCSLTTFFMAFESHSLIYLHYTPDFICSDNLLVTFDTVIWISQNDFETLINNQTLYSISGFNNDKEQCWAAIRRNNSRNLEGYACSNLQFNKSVMHRTVVTDYSLVCERKLFLTSLESCIFISIAIGFAIGMFTDSISRKTVFLSFLTWEIVTSLILPLITSMPALFVIRIMQMLSSPVNYVGINIVQEILPISKRSVYGNLYWLSYAIGFFCSAALAKLTKDWKLFRMYGLIPLILYIPLYFVIPESPRWLTLNGRYKEFQSVLERIAFWNSVKLPNDFFEVAIATISSTESGERITNVSGNNIQRTQFRIDKIIDILYMPNMRKRAFVHCLYMASVCLCYYGLSAINNFASSDIFINSILMGVSEIFAPLIGWMWGYLFSRRKGQLILFLFTTVTICVSSALAPVSYYVSTALAVVGKSCVSTLYTLGSLTVMESYPTSLRNLGIFFTLSVANGVAVFSPQINSLKNVHNSLPVIVYAICTITSGLVMYFILPETKYCPLPQTLRQAERLVQGHEMEWSEWIKTISESN